jgi:hypothetical protein
LGTSSITVRRFSATAPENGSDQGANDDQRFPHAQPQKRKGVTRGRLDLGTPQDPLHPLL